MRKIGPVQLLAVLLVVALITAALGGPRNVEATSTAPRIPHGVVVTGGHYDRKLEKFQPELVIFGNSILEAAVDPIQLGEHTGLRCFNLMIHGSASAVWYAGLRYVLQTKEYRPKYVAIFFRDILLTHPTYRTDPRYHPWIHFLAFGDPLLDELVFDPPVDPITDLMHDHWSLYRERAETRNGIEYWAREGLLSGLLGVESSRVEEAVASTFATDRLVPELATEEEAAAGASSSHLPYFDFDGSVDRSFLPAIIDMTEEAGVELILVRMRSRRDVLTEFHDQLPERFTIHLQAYIEKLAAYADEREITFIDMTEEEALGIEHYAIGDHLNLETGQPLFTRLLAKRLGESGVGGGE